MIEILEVIKNKHSADRADLMEISESTWEKVKATSRGYVVIVHTLENAIIK